MKDYVEVDEKKCDEVHNCMCTKEVGEKHIVVDVETFSQNRRCKSV